MFFGTKATYFTLFLSLSAFGDCHNDIIDTQIDFIKHARETLESNNFRKYKYVALSLTTFGGVNALAQPVAMTGAGAISTTIDKASELNEEENYIAMVLLEAKNAIVSMPSFEDQYIVGPRLASFIKKVKRELSLSYPEISMPEDRTIIQAITTLNESGDACTRDSHFYIPLIQDLIFEVVNSLVD